MFDGCREFNKVADALSNEAISKHNAGVTTTVWTIDSFDANNDMGEVLLAPNDEASIGRAREGSTELKQPKKKRQRVKAVA